MVIFMSKHLRNVKALLLQEATAVGAKVDFGLKSKHHFYEVTYNGDSRRRPFTINDTNGAHGQLKQIYREFHRAIKELSSPGG
jgi:hypothetical protein